MGRFFIGFIVAGGLLAIAAHYLLTNNVSSSDDTHRTKVEQFRAEKERAFRENPDSPLTSKQKSKFKGLNYFPISDKYLIRTPVELHKSEEVIEMLISDGSTREYRILGKVRFELAGKTQELTVYKPAEHLEEEYLFLPFYDQTTAEDTYGSGRYVEPIRIEGTLLEIDFNLAYNPYCAYNPKYRCPIPPNENKISVAVKAGEKIPDFKH
jgi:uncharacterized protein (DUF1684 family)